MARDVFISYRGPDSKWAERICTTLEQGGISCWMAPRDIPPGEEWANAIIAGLQRCHTLILLLSSHSKAGKQIAREVETADRLGMRIVTCRLEDVTPPPNLQYFLNNIQWVDAFADEAEALQTLARAVRANQQFPAQKTVATDVASIAATLPQPHGIASGSSGGRWKLPLVAAGVMLVAGVGAGFYWMSTTRSAPSQDPAKPSPVINEPAQPVRPVSRPDEAKARQQEKAPEQTPPQNKFVPGSAEARTAARMAHDKARDAMERKRWDTALYELNNAILWDPSFVDAWYERAKLHFESKLFDKAVEDATRAIELKPFADFYVIRGRAYLNRDRFDEAVKDFTVAIDKTHGKAPLALRGRSAAYRNLGKMELAAQDNKQLKELEAGRNTASK